MACPVYVCGRYRKLLALFSEIYGMSPSKLPRHRPRALDAFYPGPKHADEDGHMIKYIPKSKT